MIYLVIMTWSLILGLLVGLVMLFDVEEVWAVLAGVLAGLVLGGLVSLIHLAVELTKSCV